MFFLIPYHLQELHLDTFRLASFGLRSLHLQPGNPSVFLMKVLKIEKQLERDKGEKEKYTCYSGLIQILRQHVTDIFGKLVLFMYCELLRYLQRIIVGGLFLSRKGIIRRRRRMIRRRRRRGEREKEKDLDIVYAFYFSFYS